MSLLMDRREPKPWPMLVAILVAALLGSIAAPVQVLLAKQARAASRQDVRQNRQIIEDAATRAHQERVVLCAQLNDLRLRYRLPPVDCFGVR